MLGQALACLSKYGIPMPDGDSDVWGLILRHAPLHPMRAYALGAAYGLDSVCVLASPHTLGVSLSTLTDGEVSLMGAIYLRRLMFLHMGRRDALKRVVARTPAQHAPTVACSLMDQVAITRMWNAAVADVLTITMPQNAAPDTLIGLLSPILRSTDCLFCGDIVQRRIARVGSDWLNVRRTI